MWWNQGEPASSYSSARCLPALTPTPPHVWAGTSRYRSRGWVYDCESVACESIRRSRYRRLPFRSYSNRGSEIRYFWIHSYMNNVITRYLYITCLYAWAVNDPAILSIVMVEQWMVTVHLTYLTSDHHLRTQRALLDLKINYSVMFH
jgi:hypothetical protein